MVKPLKVVLAVSLVLYAFPVAAVPKRVAPDWMAQITKADFVFDNAVRKTKDLPTASLRKSRLRMLSGVEIGSSELRALADHGDGLAAFRYGKLLQEAGKPDPDGAAAHYFAIAAYTGRAFAVAPLARLLKTEGSFYSKSRLRHCLNAMTVQALSGNAKAATLLGEMYADGKPFGRDLAKAQQFLAMVSDGNDPKAALNLGLALMSDADDAAAGHVGALSALRLAAAGSDLSVRVTAENLMRLIEPPTPAIGTTAPGTGKPEVNQ